MIEHQLRDRLTERWLVARIAKIRLRIHVSVNAALHDNLTSSPSLTAHPWSISSFTVAAAKNRRPNLHSRPSRFSGPSERATRQTTVALVGAYDFMPMLRPAAGLGKTLSARGRGFGRSTDSRWQLSRAAR